MSGPWTRYAAPAADAPTPEAAEGPWSTYASGPEAADQKAPPPAAELHTYSTRAPNGRTVSFKGPANASDDEIRKLAVKATGSRIYAKSAVKRDGTPLPQTDNSAASGFVKGLEQPIDTVSGWIEGTPVGEGIDAIRGALGKSSLRDRRLQSEDERSNNSRTGYQALGNIAATLPLAVIPGANTGAGIVASGAASGALLGGSEDLHGAVRDATFGGIGGFVGGAASRTLGALASGVTAPAAQALRAAGVPLTLGQIGKASGNLAGRIVGGIEDRAAGLPIVGNVINNARNRGTEAYNRAVLGRSLATVGETIPDNIPVGREMVRHVGDRLSARYQQLLPNLTATPDAAYQAGMQAAMDSTRTLPGAVRQQYVDIISDAITPRTQGGSLSGEALKDAEEKLADMAAQYRTSGDVDQRRLGQALGQARDQLRALVERSNPQHAGELQALNRGWAQLATAETAAGRVGNTDGIFTPKAYAAAARAADGSVRKRATARGTFPNQALTDAAADILPNSVPDSGTAGRLATAGLFGGAAYVDPREHPIAAGALATAGALSSRGGQRALNTLALGARPALVSRAAVPLNAISRYAPQLVAPAVVTPRD